MIDFREAENPLRNFGRAKATTGDLENWTAESIIAHSISIDQGIWNKSGFSPKRERQNQV